MNKYELKSADGELLTPEEVANLLKVSGRTLESWRYKGIGPKFLRLTKRLVRYRREDINRWQKENLFQSTSQL